MTRTATPDDDAAQAYWEQQAQDDAEVEAHERELAERDYGANHPWGEQQAQVDWLESRYDAAYGYDD